MTRRSARRAIGLLLSLLVIAAAVLVFMEPDGPGLIDSTIGGRTSYTVDERIEQYASAVEHRRRPDVERAGLRWPVRELAYVAFKDARRLEVYGREAGGAWRFVRAYPMLAASGRPGPKLREGDRQVPEGIYRAAVLNPNSRFHLSIGLDYPNALDRSVAASEGRTQLGGDIMIHGNSVSIGCLAMGDEAAEDLFIMAAIAGRENLRIIVAPTDFRVAPVASVRESRAWVRALYHSLDSALREYPLQ
ncbi:MAG TPA: L,D-transpeptidase family protein [Candidatus Kapabacteria bacterium]|jgi:hypothetical protein|nr:L,D-transpeptidase family protein [Candidatus Kapabacteria bacterium]